MSPIPTSDFRCVISPAPFDDGRGPSGSQSTPVLTVLRPTLQPRAGDRRRAAPATPRSVAGGQRDVEALLLQLLTEPLKSLILGDRERPAVARALELPRRILDVRLHQ